MSLNTYNMNVNVFLIVKLLECVYDNYRMNPAEINCHCDFAIKIPHFGDIYIFLTHWVIIIGARK